MANRITNRTRPAHSDREFILLGLTSNVRACVRACVLFALNQPLGY